MKKTFTRHNYSSYLHKRFNVWSFVGSSSFLKRKKNPKSFCQISHIYWHTFVTLWFQMISCINIVVPVVMLDLPRPNQSQIYIWSLIVYFLQDGVLVSDFGFEFCLFVIVFVFNSPMTMVMSFVLNFLVVFFSNSTW